MSGRELLDPSEVRMVDNTDAILFVRGERAVKDSKYDIMKHPNVGLTEDGGAEPFVHGRSEGEIADIVVESVWYGDGDKNGDYNEQVAVVYSGYELLSEADVLERIEKGENAKNEKGNTDTRNGEAYLFRYP